MITNKDIIKLAEIFPTRSDLDELKSDIDKLKETNRSVLTILDGLAKTISNLRTDHLAVMSLVDRHERWFGKLSDGTGIKLE